MSDYDHIQIVRQEKSFTYRAHPNPTAPKPPSRQRAEHGKKIETELSQATKAILATRSEIGIKSDNLMVLEISSEALSNDLLEVLLDKFKIWLVEEAPVKDNYSKLIVQFENKAAIDCFNTERQYWQKDIKEPSILTYAKRRDLFSCIDSIRNLSREDRIGPRLKLFMADIKNKGFFIVDIDIWYNNDSTKILEIERCIRDVLGTGESKLLGDLFEISGLLLGRAKVDEFSLNALLNMDIICSIDIPSESINAEPNNKVSCDVTPIVKPIEPNAPLATILDSGIFSANPLLKGVILAEKDFDETENTLSDLHGHGTGVAGITVYGDLYNVRGKTTVTPLVRICNGKIMHNQDNAPSFREDVRPEKLVKDAILYFYQNYNCRIFNLSAGNSENIYDNKRQFPWASMLDDLSRELDIVIIVSAGNVSYPQINKFNSRQECMEKARDQLFSPEHRLIDPATSALSITVGAITRCSEPMPLANSVSLSVGLKDYPSVFTRIGSGVNKSIKPDFVDYGGNFALYQMPRGTERWRKTDRNLMELSLSNTADEIFKGFCGTSFSAPHVTHVAARLERILEKQLGKKPSANLIRAMLANSAIYSPEMKSWGENSKDIYYTGNSNPKQERLMRLNGYGKISDRILKSSDNYVTLFAEDKLPLRDCHIYKIPVPDDFLKGKVIKSITVSLAYNPVTRIGRKEYLANNLWIEIFRKIDENMIIQLKSKNINIAPENILKNIPNEYRASFSPGSTTIQSSTLQQRRWYKNARGGADLLFSKNGISYIYILVTGKEKFKYVQQNQPQPYALCVTFDYQADDSIDLYSKILSNVKIKISERLQTRVKTH